MKRLRVVVQGRVQGVGFRQFVLELARQLQLVGMVRNLRDGDVEVVAEGEQGALEALLAHLQHGPHGSRVDNLHSVWFPADGDFTTFTIAATC